MASHIRAPSASTCHHGPDPDMAQRAMLGRKAAWGERSCNCCYVGHSKRAWKRIERRQWQRETREG